jgi:hypothetical protein
LESNQPEELGRKITPGASRFGLIRRGLHRFFQRRDDDRGVGVAEEARALPARAKAHAPSGAKRTKEILREPKQLTSGAVEHIRQWTEAPISATARLEFQSSPGR